jgi:hypothetical protein
MEPDYISTHIKIWVTRMKTTVELSDLLFEQAKAAARAQGITLKALIETGLHLAIHAKNALPKNAAWPDLTFHPTEAGYSVSPTQWREAANPDSWPR